ncbi:MAG TPA: MFS transporter [Alphaproteobacteria bacterium]|nr:MFS transporter [Alphaproteobacteria bacterium]
MDERKQPKTGETPPIVFLVLALPFGASYGYFSVVLSYLLAHAGVSVAAIASMIGIGFLPQTWKVLWAPIVDTTLTSKRWFHLGTLTTGAMLLVTAFVPIRARSLLIFDVLVFVSNLSVSFAAMAADNLMANATRGTQKGRAGGWYQAGNLGGAGVGGGGALWLVQHSGFVWTGGALIFLICAASSLALLFVAEPKTEHRSLHYLHSLLNVGKDVWESARTRLGMLALLICFLPIGTGAASNLWAAVSSDWHASADTVALINGALGGVISAVGCIAGGHLSDRLNRQAAYALYSGLIAFCAIGMALAPLTEVMFMLFTLIYAFVSGLCYAGFSALVLEAIGHGAAATKYNLYASLSNMPIAYMTVVDGWVHTGHGARAMLFAEAGIGFAGIAFFTMVARVARVMTQRRVKPA